MSERAEGPLAGLLAVSVEQAVAAPFVTSRLADAGARVIKVERPEGDFARFYDHVVAGECAWFVWLNRGKESIVLDIKDADDSALLHRIIARGRHLRAEPRARRRQARGVRFGELRRRHPRLITCDISGYGESGPYAHMKAYDFLIQCESGIASVTGSPESASRVGVSVCDIGAGLNAYGAILEALHARHRSGRGSGIAVSLFDGMADWMTVPLLHYEHGGKAPPRTGLSHAMIAPYGAYPVGDGGRMVIAIQNEREWARFCEAILGDAALASDPALRRPPGPPRQPARDGRAHRRRLRPPRHGLAGGRAAQHTDRLRPPQRGLRPIAIPSFAGRGWRRRPGPSRSLHRRCDMGKARQRSAPCRRLGRRVIRFERSSARGPTITN